MPLFHDLQLVRLAVSRYCMANDGSAAQIIQACREQVADVTGVEIAALVHQVAREASNQRSSQCAKTGARLLNTLRSELPLLCAGKSFQRYRQHVQREARAA